MGVRITFATAEFAPLVSVGGLAAASAGLVSALRANGVDIDVMIPDYGPDVFSAAAHDWVEIGDAIEVDVPQWAGPASIRRVDHRVAGLVHLVATPGLVRSHPYLQPDGDGWRDNSERFLRFSRAVAAWANAHRPDIVHLNDWHTAAAAAATDPDLAVVLSLHNAAFHGATTGEWCTQIGPRGNHYEWWGGTNPLTGGIALADAVVAVSPTHADEIRRPDGGFGLDELLRARGAAVSGIINGIDIEVWNPADDARIAAGFTADDLSGKDICRADVLTELGWPDDAMLAVAVSRLTPQKGLDLIVDIAHLLGDIGIRLVILGAGGRSEEQALCAAAEQHPHHLAVRIGYNETLAHRLFAAGDLLVMPSRFEPCGLAQLQAMRYGTVPVATAVGGLVDTVVDLDAHPRTGTGIVAASASAVDLVSALHRATRRLGDRRRLANVQRRIMRRDVSWAEPAQQYIEMYQRIAR